MELRWAKFAKEDEEQFMAAQEKGDIFVGLETSWLADTNDEVIRRHPPQYIVGKQLGEEREILTEETEDIKVTLYEVDCEYIYSNPTGMFNLSVPDKLLRTKNYTVLSYV